MQSEIITFTKNIYGSLMAMKKIKIRINELWKVLIIHGRQFTLPFCMLVHHPQANDPISIISNDHISILAYVRFYLKSDDLKSQARNIQLYHTVCDSLITFHFTLTHKKINLSAPQNFQNLALNHSYIYSYMFEGWEALLSWKQLF